MREEYFEVRVDKDDTIYRLNTVKGKYGAASCWDLHLKATLNILGRVTTLMQCGYVYAHLF
jgi:hypothetical protein